MLIYSIVITTLCIVSLAMCGFLIYAMRECVSELNEKNTQLQLIDAIHRHRILKIYNTMSTIFKPVLQTCVNVQMNSDRPTEDGGSHVQIQFGLTHDTIDDLIDASKEQSKIINSVVEDTCHDKSVEELEKLWKATSS